MLPQPHHSQLATHEFYTLKPHLSPVSFFSASPYPFILPFLTTTLLDCSVCICSSLRSRISTDDAAQALKRAQDRLQEIVDKCDEAVPRSSDDAAAL